MMINNSMIDCSIYNQKILRFIKQVKITYKVYIYSKRYGLLPRVI